MKKLLFVLAIGAFAACNNNSESTEAAPDTSAVTAPAETAPAPADTSATAAPVDSVKTDTPAVK